MPAPPSIRIPANDSLERDIAELLARPVGRPSHKPVVWYKGFLYRELVADQFAATVGETGGRLVKHARYYWLMPAEAHLSRRRYPLPGMLSN